MIYYVTVGLYISFCDCRVNSLRSCQIHDEGRLKDVYIRAVAGYFFDRVRRNGKYHGNCSKYRNADEKITERSYFSREGEALFICT